MPGLFLCLLSIAAAVPIAKTSNAQNTITIDLPRNANSGIESSSEAALVQVSSDLSTSAEVTAQEVYQFPDPTFCPIFKDGTVVQNDQYDFTADRPLGQSDTQYYVNRNQPLCREKCCHTPLHFGFGTKNPDKGWPTGQSRQVSKISELEKTSYQCAANCGSSYEVCSNELACGPGKKCCHFQGSIAPGFCRDTCAASGWEELVSSCRSNADCTEHSNKQGATSNRLVCCVTLEGSSGSCRETCSSLSMIAFGCGPKSDCTNIRGVSSSRNKCCQQVNVWSAPLRQCAANCDAAGQIEVTNKRVHYTTGGLPFVTASAPPTSDTSTDSTQKTLRFKMLHFSEIVYRAAQEPEALEAFIAYTQRKEVLELCTQVVANAKVMSHHIINMGLLPLSTFVLGEVAAHDRDKKDMVASIDATVVNKLTQKGDAEVMTPVWTLLSEDFLKEETPFVQATDWWQTFHPKFQNAMDKVLGRCVEYATTVWSKRNGREFPDSHAGHVFSLFRAAVSLMHKMPLTSLSRELQQDNNIVRAWEGLQQCTAVWERIFYGMFYFEKALAARADNEAHKTKLANTFMSVVGTALSSVTFGGSAALMKVTATFFNYKREKAADEFKKANQLFFEFLREKQKELKTEKLNECHTKNVDLGLLCIAGHFGAHKITPAASDLCDKLATAASTAVAIKDLPGYKWATCIRQFKTLYNAYRAKPDNPKENPVLFSKESQRTTALASGTDPEKAIATTLKAKCGDIEVLPEAALKYSPPGTVLNRLRPPADTWPALRDQIELLAEAKELRKLLKDWRMIIRTMNPGKFDDLPVTHVPTDCRWENMIREQFESVVEVFKVASSMMACGEAFEESEGQKYIKQALLHVKPEYKEMVKLWEQLFPDTDALWAVVEALMGMVEAGADATKDIMGAKFKVVEKGLGIEDSDSKSEDAHA